MWLPQIHDNMDVYHDNCAIQRPSDEEDAVPTERN